MDIIYNLEVYTGKRNNESTHDLPLSTSVVLSLTSTLQQKGYHIYFDNFYTSPELCKRLDVVAVVL